MLVSVVEEIESVIRFVVLSHGASLVAQLIKNRSAMQEILIQFLGQENTLEKV